MKLDEFKNLLEANRIEYRIIPGYMPGKAIQISQIDDKGFQTMKGTRTLVFAISNLTQEISYINMSERGIFSEHPQWGNQFIENLNGGNL